MKPGKFTLKPYAFSGTDIEEPVEQAPAPQLPRGYTHETLPQHSIEGRAIEKGILDFRQMSREDVHGLQLDRVKFTQATRPLLFSRETAMAMEAMYRRPPDSPLKPTSCWDVGRKVASPELIAQQGLVKHRPRFGRSILVPPCYENVKRIVKEWIEESSEQERFTREQAAIVIKNVCKTLDPRVNLDETFINRAFERIPNDVHLYKERLLTSLPDCLDQMTWVKTLNVSGNKIKKLPALPPHLTTLEASRNVGIDLGPLPESLEILSVEATELRELPILPPNLIYLQATRCQLKFLSTLPNSLNTLILNHNDLRALPEILPMELAKLHIASNPRLTVLPELPYKLMWLNIGNTSIKKLPMSFKTDKMWVHLTGCGSLDEDSKSRIRSAPVDARLTLKIGPDHETNRFAQAGAGRTGFNGIVTGNRILYPSQY